MYRTCQILYVISGRNGRIQKIISRRQIHRNVKKQMSTLFNSVLNDYETLANKEMSFIKATTMKMNCFYHGKLKRTIKVAPLLMSINQNLKLVDKKNK